MATFDVHVCWADGACWNLLYLNQAEADAVMRKANQVAERMLSQTGKYVLRDLVILWPEVGLAYSIMDEVVLGVAD